MGLGSAVLVLGPNGLVDAATTKGDKGEFFFVQLSDSHWGFNDPKINPDSQGTLKKAIAAVNSMKTKPDFIVFTGDLSQTTDDPQERRKRMTEVREIISGLKVKDIRFMAGEHDASLDNGAAFQEMFGKTHYTIDNVSDPTSSIGDAQLQWMDGELKKLDKEARIVVFTHRPLFDLYPDWDWWTRDGAKAVDLLMPYKNVTVFYGHIHQENHHMTGHINHHAAHGLMWPLPAPGSLPKKVFVPWDPAKPYNGLGWRRVEVKAEKNDYALTEYPIKKG